MKIIIILAFLGIAGLAYFLMNKETENTGGGNTGGGNTGGGSGTSGISGVSGIGGLN